MAVRRPVLLRDDLRPLALAGALPRLALAAPLTDPRRRHHVVHVQPDPERPAAAGLAEGGHQEGRRIDEVRRELDHQLALEQRLANQSEVEVLEVAEAAVDHLRGPARGAHRVVVRARRSATE